MSTPTSGNRRFYGRLEAMRGIAALGVAICHSFIWLPVYGVDTAGHTLWQVHGIQATVSRSIMAITNGSAAVDIFFVLSGFVLALSLEGKSISLGEWARFSLKRLFRIVPALLVSFAFIGCLLQLRLALHLFPAGVDWYDGWKFTFLTFRWLMNNVLFIASDLNPPSWTLRVEVMVALIFPAAVLLARRLGPLVNILLCVILAVSVNFAFPPEGRRVWFYFGFLFFMGIIAFMYGQALVKLLGRHIRLLALGSLALILVPGSITLLHYLAADISIGLGAAGLIVVLSSDNAVRGSAWLDTTLPRFLGRISFSFYLLHYPILYAVVLWLTNRVGSEVTARYPTPLCAACAVVSLAICIPLSWAMYSTIERPFTTLGRRLAHGVWPNHARSTTTRSPASLP
jgi:peptidoglycan/LPS O-acetylase OafA/YrhL